MMLSDALRFMFPGLVIAEPGAGECSLVLRGGVVEIAQWNRPEPQPTSEEIAAAELPATKAARIAANRAECTRRIFERYPAGRQLSASFGLYDSANVATMVDWISDMVAAENTAADEIEAATTVAAVEAVSVSWPA